VAGLTEKLLADPRARYALLALATFVVALVGYLGYVVYPRFELPAGTGGGLLLLAAGAGIASFFSPCSFPLLLSTLAHAPRGRGGDEGAVFVFAAALALGAATFFLLAGTLIALAGAALFEGVTFTSTTGRLIRALVGALLILLGLVQLGRLRISFRGFEPAVHGLLRRQAGFRRRRPLGGHFVFGFGYILAGFG
jgi:cytochrome c biogenesis protein CcdA